MTLGGADNDRKVVVYQGIGVFTKDNYKATAVTPPTTATTTGATGATTILTKAPTHVAMTMAVDGTTGDDITTDVVHDGGVEVGVRVVSSPSKGKMKTTGTSTDAW